MLQTLTTKNIGPMPEMELEFGNKLNVITGDNGLGKSFLLDVIWYTLTGSWPKEVNPKLSQGYMVRPHNDEGFMQITFDSQKPPCAFRFNFETQSWYLRKDSYFINKSMVIYAMSDGSFALWDAQRRGNVDFVPLQWRETLHLSAPFVFSSQEVWNGLESDKKDWICNGLLRDWANWQRENKEPFALLQAVLASLSPIDEPIGIGELTRVSIDDVRDIPTIKTPYGEVPVVHASSGIKRILLLAYLLTWAKVENAVAAKLRNKTPAESIVFLVDELEAHLHPKWQRSIAQSFIIPNITQNNAAQDSLLNANVQFFITTHSPLVMASLESYFLSSEGVEHCAWFDIDLNPNTGDIGIQERQFAHYGTASNWLTSPAFDLKYATSLEHEEAEEKVYAFLQSDDQTEAELYMLKAEIEPVLSEINPLWLDLRDLCRKNGWAL